MKDIDYELLLMKYRRHVRDSYGIDFVATISKDGDSYKLGGSEEKFSAKEIRFMKKISQENL